MENSLRGKRVCVIGSGISGLSAAWLLHRNGASVTLLEKEEECGGHTLTDRTSPYPVDLGFQVMNLTTYPHFVGFLECLGVDTQPSNMSFALSVDDGRLEWGSDNLDTIFAQRKNLASPSFLAMLRDVIRFGKEAPKVLEASAAHIYGDMTLGAYLAKHGYSTAFTNNYVVPMCAAVWSVPGAQVLVFPVQMLVRFWVNHHLLDIFQRPLWRVVRGRSQTYVQRVCQELPDVRTGTPVARVTRTEEGVDVETAAGGSERFDAVIFATHSDVTLRLLGSDADPQEREVLAAVPYSDSDVYLHTDPTLMPRNRKVWASWNFLGSSAPGADTAAVCVSYWVNRLQELPPGAPNMFVTLNPPHPPAEEHVIRRLSLAHPVFSGASVAAQAQLPSLQGRRNTYYAGAWTSYGFHEDGIRSAVAVVEAMGGSLPWVPRATSPKMTISQQVYMNLFDKYTRSTLTQGRLRLILPNGDELLYGKEGTTDAPVAKGEEWRGRPALRCTLRIYDMDFFRKMVLRHDVGLGESYMAGDYEADSLGGFIAVLSANAVVAETERGHLGLLNWFGERLLYLSHLKRPNTIKGSRKNIEEHYDAGNAMYKLFLDETLTYSSGVYHGPADTLHSSQLNKIDALIAKAQITASDHVLEIGCGWGGFAIRAVQATGCRWTGITISKEQLAEANERVAAAGLQDRITLLFCDYRDTPATLGAASFDVVVSVEMIEAVGHEHLRPYFGIIGRMLKPGGRAVLQAICCADERYEAYCNTSDFIREHIFPGGHLPSLGAIADCCRGTGLAVRDTHDIGPDYAITLRSWRDTWEARRSEVLALGYSDRFWRKFRFYFAFCEAAFDSRYIHNYHVLLVKSSNPAELLEAAADGSRAAAASGLASQQLSSAASSLVDPMTQGLIALYFFLAGLLVSRHAFMWLLPSASCLMALVAGATHFASKALVPSYRTLTVERRALWCGDIAHMLYSAVVSAAALAYVLREPRALQLGSQPTDIIWPSIITASSAGVFAFNLWMCVRARLFERTALAIVQYTVLLVLFGTASFRGVGVPFLAATLASEVFSVAFLMGKLQEMSGMGRTSLRRYTRFAEQATLVLCRLVPHAAVAAIVVANPGAFGSPLYYAMCLVGMAFTNWLNLHKAYLLFTKGNASEVAAAGKVRVE
ncbi:Cyclopropane-fatty-acyl-phospholipid synthase [Tetrabaena socialis]|uniref:Cyclopropane-fatty-acyl-phospholipid synthase n=1 Tax=Tetrabaena socialis TaxID=47790 RepID=A0A2J8ACJ9_9CHLO|nr:Cyclopropane-fatty-acyl-phospholipid synthase [Tetrabaena socialis]|eukprot:PNH10244.1 Cyclopropane-fatty-acyl-phospholipid synthase [Tetrabaena socialis]